MLPIPKFYKYLTGIDIAFVDGGLGADTITQTAAQFLVAGLVSGDVFSVSGSASNDGDYTIVSVVAGTITLATATLTAEIAGATVIIRSELTTFAFGNCDAGGYAPDSTGLIIQLHNDLAGAGSDDMTSVRLQVRDSDGNELELWTTNRWIEIKSSGVGGTAVDDSMTTFKAVGKDHPLWVGDIPTVSYRTLYVRLHGPVSAQEGNIAFQIIAIYQDSALSGISHVVHFQDLLAADPDYVHAAITGTGASQDITTVITNPDVPRVATITTTNNAAPAGIVTITGLVRGVSTTDEITIVAGGLATGVKPFDTITNINTPVGLTAGDTVTVGIGDILGLPREIISTGDVYKKKVNAEDKTDELAGNINITYGTVDCGVIVAYEETTIWYLSD